MADMKSHLVHTEEPPSYEPAAAASSSAVDTSILPLPLSLPTTDASAPEVRTYIRSYLHHNAHKYDLQPSQAVDIAEKWRFGSGQELRDYDRPAFESLFGLEIGLMLSKHVEAQVVNERKDAESSSYRANTISMAVSSVFILAMFIFAAQYSGDSDDPDARVAAFVLAGFVSIPFVAVGIVMQFCFLMNKIVHNRRRAIEKGVEGRRGYLRLNGDENDQELRHMEVV